MSRVESGFKLPTQAVLVDLALMGQKVRRVEVYVPGRQAWSRPRQGVAGLLEQEREFLPAHDVEDGTPFLFNRSKVIWVAIPLATSGNSALMEPEPDEEEWFDQRRPVSVELVDGRFLDGQLLYSAPVDSSRVVDHVNLPGRFFRLWKDDSVFMVNKDFVSRVLDQNPEWEDPHEG